MRTITPIPSQGIASHTAHLLNELVAKERPKIHEPVLVVVAHPDDETIGIGAQIPRLAKLTLVHVTDGSPADLTDAHRSGYSSAPEYALARRAELQAALALAGVSEQCQTLELKIRDQEAIHNFAIIIRSLRDMIQRFKPSLIFTHPYEGGHPDHDATAFCVQMACASLPAPPSIVEMASYHQRNGRLATGEFLPPPQLKLGIHIREWPVWKVSLKSEEVRLKQRMIACFRTQQQVLKSFLSEAEQFRIAPNYDFTMPPHEGILWYETLPFGITGEHFRWLVRKELHIESLCRWK